MLTPLFLNLARHDFVSDEEKAILVEAMSHRKEFAVGQDIVSVGSRPTYSSVLLAGFAARYKLLADGGRQITALHIPGDFVDLHAFLLKTMDHGIVALSPCQVAYAEHSDLKEITEKAPHLTRLLWLDTLIDGAIHREWIVAMGRRAKKSHLAHLICELFVRLEAVNLTNGMTFHFPISQAEMADALGLSVVHMNRVIQGLRREGLISWVNQSVSILDWKKLQELAEFDQTYLSMKREPR
ncbi:Crp/Fnr family transcriptional regulator [Limoniibacter endophyticus]|uniref:Crp/Fnr family transcriptional regulator n=1 Tax=Limoniibacter endophyticus TaxID=1565040 RepID=A0A8J3GGG2_9HYPH|nr:Crp/Fnr family transcriptional regulator [Limoniibacter endophyticus]GHC65232.1 Crp/Fnr family transcriptional regulator [Limoniibacter endophyticus]